MTDYYIDFDNGNDGTNDGTTATKTNGDGPWATLDQFVENVRSAGDKAIVRRGMTQTVTSDLIPISNGTRAAPIIIEADYDDAWSDQVDLSATATATLTFGSKTITFSADVSGVVAAGDVIYAASDDNRVFSYVVDSVVTTTVTLYLPYKGDQAGSGKTMHNMQSAPIWNIITGNFEMNFDNDDHWKIQGLHMRGTDSNGIVEIDDCAAHEFVDCIFTGNEVSAYGIKCTDEQATIVVRKCLFIDLTAGIASSSSGSYVAQVYDSYFESGATETGMEMFEADFATVIESEFVGFTKDIEMGTGSEDHAVLRLRNVLLSSINDPGAGHHEIGREDANGTVNDSLFVGVTGSLIQSDTVTVRSGGGSSSIKVSTFPGLNTTWDFGRMLVFEYPIYADTSSKTYTVYFKSSGTGNWTADPTAIELWIELEYWGHATNIYRKITKSTGVVDFNGDDSTWLTITVTAQPSIAGVAYLRCWYAKPREGGKSNIFYCDTKIGVT